jgi:hypothetical protein
MRSKLTNGAKTLDVDQRTRVARRYHDLCAAVASDQGGSDELSEARLQLIRRFCGNAVLAETMEAEVVSGKSIDVAQYAALCSTMCRIGSRIGIDRRMRNITPSLKEYMDMKASEERAEADE